MIERKGTLGLHILPDTRLVSLNPWTLFEAITVATSSVEKSRSEK
jgi:hypothetical protein